MTENGRAVVGIILAGVAVVGFFLLILPVILILVQVLIVAPLYAVIGLLLGL